MNTIVATLASTVLGIVVLTSCSSVAAVVDYDDETKSGFLSACADSVGDSQLVSNVCGCVYLEVEDTFSYGEMVELQTPIVKVDNEQDEDLASPLADEIKEIVAGCVADQTVSNS